MAKKKVKPAPDKLKLVNWHNDRFPPIDLNENVTHVKDVITELLAARRVTQDMLSEREIQVTNYQTLKLAHQEAKKELVSLSDHNERLSQKIIDLRNEKDVWIKKCHEKDVMFNELVTDIDTYRVSIWQKERQIEALVSSKRRWKIIAISAAFATIVLSLCL